LFGAFSNAISSRNLRKLDCDANRLQKGYSAALLDTCRAVFRRIIVTPVPQFYGCGGAGTSCVKSITTSLAEVSFAQKITICLFMTQGAAYVVHCTKGTCGCPIAYVLMLIRKSQLAPGRRRTLRSVQ
jgi:hypothetical protein